MLVAVITIAAGCGTTESPPLDPTTQPVTSSGPTETTASPDVDRSVTPTAIQPVAGFEPATRATVFSPAEDQSRADIEPPLLVLVPGGGWSAADPSGLAPLATALAKEGAFVVTISYRTAEEDAYFPIPVDDIACGVAFARAKALESGVVPREVVVAGHSSGAQLAAVYSLRPPARLSDCAYSAVEPDRFIGLAGPYDVVRARSQAANLFGPDRPNTADWALGNPLQQAARRPDMDVLLVHGTADNTLPIWFTEQFAEALSTGGHMVTALYPPDVDHMSVYSAEIATPIIATWLELVVDSAN